MATLKPMVNEVLLAKPAAVKSEATGKTDSLDALVNRLPIHEAKRWLHDRPMVKVPVLLVAVFLIRGNLYVLTLLSATFSEHLDIAAERNGANHIFGLAPLL